MTAFNFKAQFAADVESGKKCQTIRKSKRCKVGDEIQLYTGQRTKACRKLGDAVCTDVYEVHINGEAEKGYYRVERGYGGEMFYELDGFPNVLKFCEFFKNQYGLPFDGYVHKWRLK